MSDGPPGKAFPRKYHGTMSLEEARELNQWNILKNPEKRDRTPERTTIHALDLQLHSHLHIYPSRNHGYIHGPIHLPFNPIYLFIHSFTHLNIYPST